MKTVKAVRPYYYKDQINFKHKPFEAWKELGGLTAKSYYPHRLLHHFAYKYELPCVFNNKKEARLRFVQPYSIRFDTFPDYALYEIIPCFWDCWPDTFLTVLDWLKKHNVKTAIFTSSQFAELVKSRFPKMNVLAITEGIDVRTYKKGKKLCDRKIDFLEYGREIDNIVRYDVSGINYIRGKKNGKIVFTQEQLIDTLADSRIVAAFPKSWTNPEEAGGIETLTQRYWECMLSRCIMVGHAPKELIDLLGYNPVIEIDKIHPNEQIHNILSDINSYQELVDKNRDMAQKYGDWKHSMMIIRKYLTLHNYII